MAERKRKECKWDDFFETTAEDSNPLNEPIKETKEKVASEKAETKENVASEKAETEEKAASEKAETEENVASEKAETSVTLHKPGTSLGTWYKNDVVFLPLVDVETGQMYKLYEVIMKRLGIEIPELKDENLSDIEKESRRKKRDWIIVVDRETTWSFGRTPSVAAYRLASWVCWTLVGVKVPIKTIRPVVRATAGTLITKVRFHSLDVKKMVLANRFIIDGTNFEVDHDLTTMEISIQAALVDLYNKTESLENLPDKILIDNKWMTIQPVSQQSAQSN